MLSVKWWIDCTFADVPLSPMVRLIPTLIVSLAIGEAKFPEPDTGLAAFPVDWLQAIRTPQVLMSPMGS